MDETHDLLRALLMTSGRIAFEPVDVYDIVNPNGRGAKQVQAFNLADGTRTQREIARKVKLDAGNLSHTMKRWVDAGIVFWIGKGRDAKPLHVFPIPSKRPEEE